MPSEQRLGRDDRRELRQGPPAKPFRLYCQTSTLVIRESESAISELFAQHPILLAQIIDCLSLLLIHPTGDGDHHKPKRIENVHCSTLS